MDEMQRIAEAERAAGRLTDDTERTAIWYIGQQAQDDILAWEQSQGGWDHPDRRLEKVLGLGVATWLSPPPGGPDVQIAYGLK